ncbi:uncharacterized protein [Penaeus vannamei]|uniref:uncharacterized protein n=1 Tax=Penaeus vannamei TaxID=6689 RepID=UPI00387F9BA9
MRTESDLLALLDELSFIIWDVVGLCEVRRLGEEQMILNDGHVLFWRGKPHGSNQELGGLGLSQLPRPKPLYKNIVAFYSVSERVTSITIKLNNRYNLKIVKVYAPTCGHSATTEWSDAELHLRRERNKLTRKPQSNLDNLKTRATEFSLNIQNRYSFLRDRYLNTDHINKQVSDIINKGSCTRSRRQERQAKLQQLSLETKRRDMKVTSNGDKMELVELTKIVNKKKSGDVRKFNIEIIIEAVISVTYKLFTKVITARISDSVDSNKPREQAGFRSGFSTADHIHTLTQLREK